MSLPLEGIRVLDLGISTAGPYAARFLADLGAEVIKVEPLDGENSRSLGLRYGDAGYLFHVNNYNKKSLALKVQSREGRELFLELAAVSDVVIENFAAGTMDKWGIGFEACRAVNPAIVYCSAKGFGESGALREKRAFDTVVQGLAGLMDATGFDGDPPVKGGPSVCDLMTAAASAMAVVSALVAREEGQGCFIDTALYDMGVWSLLWLWPEATAAGGAVRATRIGNRHPAHAPHGAFACADGSVFVALTTDEGWRALAAWIGCDPAWTRAERKAGEDAIDAELTSALRPLAVADAVRRLQAMSIAAAPVQDLAAVAAHPLMAARELVTDVEHPSYGRIPLLRSPLALAGARRPPIRALPPTLGQHGDEILGDLLGHRDALPAWRAAGVVGS